MPERLERGLHGLGVVTLHGETRFVDVRLGTEITAVEHHGESYAARTREGDEIVVDLVVHGGGRIPEIDGLDLDAGGIAVDPLRPTMTKSRTISNYWLLNVRPENHVEVAAADAARMGLRDDQEVRVVSASNPSGHGC